MKVVLTGGGTGGHIYPAIGVGQALRADEAGVELLFVGSTHGPEGRLAGEANIPFVGVPSAKLTKSVSPGNLGALLKLVAGVFRARRILKDFGADVVIGTGGYTTAAVLLAARSLGCRIVIHEQNAVPGRTNLWLARISDKVCVSVDSSAAFFPNDKVVVTGMPVRPEFAVLSNKAEARRALELDETMFTILVVGGSQGARRLNELVLGMWPSVDDSRTQIIHQVGPKNLDEVREKFLAGRLNEAEDRYRVEAYVDMPLAVAAADLIICRSGASTIAEITVAGLPGVLIPYPHAYANHQKHNAEYLVRHHAGVLCEEHQASPEVLAGIISALRGNTEDLQAMAFASKRLARIDAAKSVAGVATGLVTHN